jgi:hypothetical protein
MNRQRLMPQVEELGQRVLPSAVALMPPKAAPALAAPLPPQLKHPLSGRGSGVFSTDLIPSEAGTVFHLRGSATLAGMGPVEVLGSVTSVGFIQTGRASGMLTLFGNGGSVTVELQGPVQPAFSPLPHYFHYHVTGGIGAFQHLADSGTLRLDFHVVPMGALGERGSFYLWI